jgi:hypothetical protein
MIKLGAFASDRIVNFSGVVTGRATYITGCDQYLVAPKDGGKEPKRIDEQRLVVDEAVELIEIDNSNGNGADAAAPVK